MQKLTKWYRELIRFLVTQIQQGETKVDRLLAKTNQQLHSWEQLTEDETEHLQRVFKEDLKAFSQHYVLNRGDVQQSPLASAWQGTLWAELANITDKSQVEWQEMRQDIQHKGVYLTGELVGLGHFICQQCHTPFTIYEPTLLSACVDCQATHFYRQPLQP